MMMGMMVMMITNCNNVNLTDNVPNNFSSIVHSPGFICAPHSCNKARQISFICLLFVFVYYLFICAPHSCSETTDLFPCFQTFLTKHIFVLPEIALSDFYYWERCLPLGRLVLWWDTIDHLGIYKHIYHCVVVFSISLKYCPRVRHVFHFITWTIQYNTKSRGQM